VERFLAFPLEMIPFVVISLVIAFTIHEYAHAYVAYKFGDPTAKNQGRLTLSPLAHLDPLGTLLIFIAGFGWARPVPVNRFYFKNPRLAGILVSVAGPLSNLLIAAVSLIIWFVLLRTGITENLAPKAGEALYHLFNMLIHLNVLLFLFNLLPFPPLDGYRIVEDLAPSDIRAKMTQYESFGILLFLILVITPLDQYTIYPYLHKGTNAVMQLLDSIFTPIFL
jgi:Zn-dependent protease